MSREEKKIAVGMAVAEEDYEPWHLYRLAHDDMTSDAQVASLRLELSEARNRVRRMEGELKELLTPYARRMDEAREGIEALVFERQETVESGGVRAVYRRGRKSTSWKSVATEAGADSELVAKHTRTGDPKVVVEVEDPSDCLD